jgi:hypothetical protein
MPNSFHHDGVIGGDALSMNQGASDFLGFEADVHLGFERLAFLVLFGTLRLRMGRGIEAA